MIYIHWICSLSLSLFICGLSYWYIGSRVLKECKDQVEKEKGREDSVQLQPHTHKQLIEARFKSGQGIFRTHSPLNHY